MRVLMRFTKEGNLRWISHLDTMRTLEKAFRRAHVAVTTSQGFNPHPRFSIAVPLAVGIASFGEYLEADCATLTTPPQIARDLREQLPAHMNVLYACEIPQKAPSLAAIVQVSRFSLTLPGHDVSFWEDACHNLLLKPNLNVWRNQGTANEKCIDIRSGLITLQVLFHEDIIHLEATIETSSRLYLRLQELLDLITMNADYSRLLLADTDPLRLDMGVREENNFCSLEQYFQWL